MRDDYLWDKSGEPDPDVERLERTLGRLRAEREPSFDAAPAVVAMPAARRRRPAMWIAGWAAAAVLVVIVGAGVRRWLSPAATGPAWNVARLEGRALAVDRLHAGQWLETGGGDRARVSVSTVGEMELEPGTRIRLLRTAPGEQRFSLAYGTVHAVIWAPPGLFRVDTPSATATDLGCTYTLTVDRSGAGLLRVTSGWVAFAHGGRESFVPAGALCHTHAGAGPGTPFYEDAPPGLRQAVEAFDEDPTRRGTALATIAAEARVRDAPTLWHLIGRTSGAERAGMVDALAERVPVPTAAVREGALAGDRAALDQWWNELGLGDADWWRMWESRVPPRDRVP